ncbi:MAG: stage 0 sporulation family protein [Clostridiaceae bacterium]|nr:stage 0 sporulation family protein [Clostridiaceae bacterium]
MIEVVGVRFRPNGKIYYFNPKGQKFDRGTYVIVETSRELEYGEVVIPNRMVDEEEIVPPLKDVVRVATDEDHETHLRNIEKAKRAYSICLDKIREHGLAMKLIDCEYTFDNNKLLFYFTADGRIDFRELVKDLASIFKTRIELRQVGVRDEAKTIGGLGVCGRVLCCASCLDEFQPVSIRMAKEQGLSLSPNKISGTCGRLMCCLNYEQDAYEKALSVMPGVGAVVETPDGNGVVVSSNLLKETVQVRLDKENETELTTYSVSEIKVIRDADVCDVDDFNLDLQELEEELD